MKPTCHKSKLQTGKENESCSPGYVTVGSDRYHHVLEHSVLALQPLQLAASGWVPRSAATFSLSVSLFFKEK